jgi:GDPmannose 4,6-dehydratase
VTHSVREFVQLAFEHVGLDWEEFVRVDDALLRPAEVEILQADPSKARTDLGWEPAVDFATLIAMMVDSDVERLEQKR